MYRGWTLCNGFRLMYNAAVLSSPATLHHHKHRHASEGQRGAHHGGRHPRARAVCGCTTSHVVPEAAQPSVQGLAATSINEVIRIL